MKATQKAVDDICRTALAVPADKIEWVPMGRARSVLDQMQEIATSASYFMPLFKEFKAPAFDSHARLEARSRRKSLDTLPKCIDEARKATAELCQAMGAVPDAMLEKEVILPFGGDVTMTLADLMWTCAWNMIYHLGQINQIQLMLGDAEMH